MSEVRLNVIVLPFIILAFFGGLVSFIAINPAKNFSETRNSQRSSDVLQILSAVSQYTSVEGNEVSDLGSIPFCEEGVGEIGTDEINLNASLVPDYIVGIPVDPEVGNSMKSGYTICLTGTRVKIQAPFAEGSTITVTR